MAHKVENLAPKGDEAAVVRRWVDEAEHTGTTDTYLGKRAWPRTTWNVHLVVRIASGQETGELVYANGKDVSLGGIGFFARRLIPSHTAVQIWAGDHCECVSGRIMHVTKTLHGFIMGVAFDHVPARREQRAAG